MKNIENISVKMNKGWKTSLKLKYNAINKNYSINITTDKIHRLVK